MSVISTKEISEGRGGDFEAVKGSSTRVFRITTDNAFDNESTIASAGVLPVYLSPHPSNIFLRCKGISIKLEHGRTVWLATCKYDNEPLTEDEKNRLVENPTARPAKVRWESSRFSMAIDKDAAGNALVNTAGKYFDPPIERDSVHRVARVTKNLAQVPVWLLDYEDSINQDAFQIDGLQVLPRCARLSNLRISEKLEENNITFRTVECDIEFARPPEVKDGQVLDGITRDPDNDVKGWDLLVLNQGLQEVLTDDDDEPLDPPQWRNILIDGEVANSPQLLSPSGLLLASAEPGAMFWLKYNVYKKQDWSQISALWS